MGFIVIEHPQNIVIECFDDLNDFITYLFHYLLFGQHLKRHCVQDGQNLVGIDESLGHHTLHQFHGRIILVQSDEQFNERLDYLEIIVLTRYTQSFKHDRDNEILHFLRRLCGKVLNGNGVVNRINLFFDCQNVESSL